MRTSYIFSETRNNFNDIFEDCKANHTTSLGDDPDYHGMTIEPPGGSRNVDLPLYIVTNNGASSWIRCLGLADDVDSARARGRGPIFEGTELYIRISCTCMTEFDISFLDANKKYTLDINCHFNLFGDNAKRFAPPPRARVSLEIPMIGSEDRGPMLYRQDERQIGSNWSAFDLFGTVQFKRSDFLDHHMPFYVLIEAFAGRWVQFLSAAYTIS